MQTRVQKWGNSLALRIPSAMAADLGLTEKSTVDLRLVTDRLEIIPLEEKPLSLADLLEGVTTENLHGELDSGEPVGREAW
jgi:antitoxin MazE